MTTITGATHPLSRRVYDSDRAHREKRDRWAPVAAAILTDHQRHGISDQSIYAAWGITTADRAAYKQGGYTVDTLRLTAWRRIGSHETSRHLLSHAGYIEISARDSAETVVDRIMGSGRGRVHALRDAAVLAAPMVSALLALLADAAHVEWDTDETVIQAGERAALDAAWRRVEQPNPALPSPADIYAAVVDDLGLTADYRDATVVASRWLDRHREVVERLAAHGIAWGDRLLDATMAADRARVARTTWAAYASRGAGPDPDTTGPARWYAATVDAWLLTRPRTPWLGWLSLAGRVTAVRRA